MQVQLEPLISTLTGTPLLTLVLYPHSNLYHSLDPDLTPWPDLDPDPDNLSNGHKVQSRSLYLSVFCMHSEYFI